MEVAPGQLTRTFTAPQPQSSHSRLHNSSASSFSNPHHQSHTGSSSFSTYSDPSASSISTRDTSSSAFFPQPPSSSSTPPPTSANNGAVIPTNNVINKVADKGSSLFQICVNLRNRLQAIEGFEEYIEETREFSVLSHEQEVDKQRAEHYKIAEDAGVAPEPFDPPEYAPLDPCDVLWQTFRRGYPLMAIYNALEPEVPLAIDESRIHEEKRFKAAAFKFLQACVHKLKFNTQDCFILSDLYGNDTSGFIKVATVVNRVLDLLVERGLIDPADAVNTSNSDTSREKRTQRYFIVDELVRTERTYVHHLEVLQAFKKLVEQKGTIPGDAIHDIFLNLNALLDFQRRFLIRVEQINSLPEDEQDWGFIFNANKAAFSVYEPYIANQKLCEETALREFDKLRDVGGSVELQQLVESPATLNAFLLKPFQRLSKYPLLLKDLREKGDFDEDRKESLSSAIDLIVSVLERTNSFIASQERVAAVQDLKTRVDDWKGHRIESFGELLLHGEFEVFKMDSSKQVRLYQMYLFQKILVCCKEIAEKQKGVKMSKHTNITSNGKAKLALKGRIFMQNVVETTFLSKPGNYSCRISWRTEWMSDNIESFVVKFKTEEVMRLWRDTLETQRAESVEQAQRGFNQAHNSSESVYMQQQGRLENPYKEEDTGEEDDPYAAKYGGGYGQGENQDLMSRESTSSLRSRSTTGESVNPQHIGQMLGRGKHPGAPLTLRTNQLPSSTSSGPSYFSPVADSPISSRTSSSSGITPFPRQVMPQHNGWHGEESNRFTAPAHMARNLPKDQAAYNQADPRAARASQAPAPPIHPNSLAQTRMRSASSPDVHSQNSVARHVPMNAPPVPSVPSHLANQQPAVNRSQNNSPIYSNGAPPRSSTQSPQNAGRHRMTEHSIDNHQSQEYRSSHEYAQGYGQDEQAYQSRPDSYDRQWEGGTMSPPPLSTISSLSDHQGPTNFKVKVTVPTEGSSMTLVVGYNISYQSLKDRIDAKLQRHTNLSLASGSVRLQYLYDDEMVSIQTDEDVQTAFETWKESQDPNAPAAQLGEIRLFCNR